MKRGIVGLIVAVCAALVMWLVLRPRQPEVTIRTDRVEVAATDDSPRRASHGPDGRVSEPEATTHRVFDGLETKLPPPRKVLFLGLDGLDWKLLRPWLEAGRLPNLARLMAEGSWGVMDTIDPMLSPLIWTTVATGFSPDVHGILDFVEVDPASGRLVPITSRSRRVPALWNIASAFSRTVSVVGWWASWPTETINGVMVSDRLYYTLTLAGDRELERQDPPWMVSPSSDTPRFVALRDRALRDTDWRAIQAYMDVSEAEYDAAVIAAQGMADPVDGFRRILSSTATYVEAALAVAEERPDLLMVYIEGTDEINHVLASYLAPPIVDIDPQRAAVYAAAVPRYFEQVDRWLGQLLQRCPLSEYAVVLASDHGTRWGDDRPRNLSSSSEQTAVYWHTPDAVFVVAGNGVTGAGEAASRYSVYDIAPSLVALLGLPADTAWPGRLLPGIADPELEAIDYSQKLPAVSLSPGVTGGAVEDAEQIAKLRALGYLGDEPATTSVQRTIEGRLWTPGQLTNLGLVEIERQRFDDAERHLRMAIELAPGSPTPHLHLHRLYGETERWDEADRELWIALDKGAVIPDWRVHQAAERYARLGEVNRRAAVLREATRRFPDEEGFWVELLELEMDRGRCDAAAAIGRQATARLTDRPRLYAYYGFAAACSGDIAAGRAALERSLELDPQQPQLREALAQFPR